MGIGTILLLLGIAALCMALFWIVCRPPRDFAARDDS
jgi:hypothetical protein